MKRGVLAGLLILCIGLAGCGTASAEKKTETEPAVSEEEKTEAGSAGAEELVILDDETVTVRLTEVFEIPPDKKDTETEEPAVGIAFSVTNHGEKEIVMDFRKPGVGDRPAARLLLEGDIVAPDDTQEYRYGFTVPAEEMPDPEKQPERPEQKITIEDVTEKGISGEIHLMSMEGEVGLQEFAIPGDKLPKN